MCVFFFSFNCLIIPNADAYVLAPPIEGDSNFINGKGLLKAVDVNPWTGIVSYTEDDITVKDLIFPIGISRTYKSNMINSEGAFGRGWTWSLGMRLYIDSSSITLLNEQGRTIIFKSDAHGIYTSPYAAGIKITRKGNMFVQTVPGGKEYLYNENGFLTKISDSKNNYVSFERQNEKIYRISNNKGKWITINWTGNRITEIQDITGRIIFYQYDTHDALSSVIHYNRSKTEYNYDQSLRLSKILYADGKALEIRYQDTGGKVTKISAGQNTVFYSYTGTKTIITHGNDEKWTFETLNKENVRKIVNPWGGMFEFKYDKGRLVSRLNPYGGLIKYSYYDNGLVSEVTDVQGRKTTYAYNSKWLLPSEIQHPSGEVERFNYDDKGSLISITDRLGRKGQFSYYQSGLLHRSTDANGVEQIYTYNNLNLPDTLTNGLGGTTHLNYDKALNISGLIDPMGIVSKVEYSKGGRPARAFTADVEQLSFDYDRAGNPLKINITGFQPNVIEYDQALNIAVASSPAGDNAAFKRNSAGRITEAMIAGRGIISFKYKNGSVIEAKDAAKNTWKYSYNKAGQLLSATNAANAKIEFRYGVDGNVVEKKYSDGDVAKFTYDSEGRVTEAANRSAKVAIQYDAIGRPVYEKISNMPAVKAIYEKDGKNFSLLIGDTQIKYRYNSSGKVSRISTLNGPSVTLTYSKSEKVESMEYSNGVKAFLSYDKVGRAASIVYKKGNDIIAGKNYAWNNSNLISEIEDIASKKINKIKYDADTRLVEVKGGDNISIVYGKGGIRESVMQDNRPDERYKYDESYRIINAGNTTYGYDANGNRILKRNNAGSDRYTFSLDGMLTRVRLNNNKEISYRYDALNRRVAINKNNRTEHLIYFGPHIVASADDNGVIKRIFVPTFGMDVPVFMKNDNDWFMYHQDINGSVIALTDQSGKNVAQYDYSPFGTPKKIVFPNNPFGFAGMWYENETGLYYARARDYDPEVGSFIQPDPFPGYSIMPGSQTLYAFAGSNPISNRDPEGQFLPILIGGAILGAVLVGVVVAPFVKSVGQRNDALNNAINEGGDVSDRTTNQYNQSQRNIQWTSDAAQKGNELVSGMDPIPYAGQKISETGTKKVLGIKDDDAPSSSGSSPSTTQKPFSSTPTTSAGTTPSTGRQPSRSDSSSTATPSGTAPSTSRPPSRPGSSSTTTPSGTAPSTSRPPSRSDSSSSGGGYNPLNDPAVASGGGRRKPPVDTTQISQLGDQFQSGTPGGQTPPDKQGGAQTAGQQPQVIQQPSTYTDGGRKPDDTSGTGATPQQPPYSQPGTYPPGTYPQGSYPPYGQPTYPPSGDRTGGRDWTGWAQQRPPYGQQPQQPGQQPQQPGQQPQQPGQQPQQSGQQPQQPTDIRTVECSSTTKSGADAPATITVKVGKTKGTAKFSYNMYTVKDRMIVQYGGQTLLDTGCISGSKTVPLNLSGLSDVVTVIVQPACETKGTQWNFTLECPK
jgi:RHS repeat-associated protein